MKKILLLISFISLFLASLAQAVVYNGTTDNRAGFPFVPGLTGQTRALLTGSDPRGGLRLEWQVDNETTPGAWTYTYRLVRGVERNKGFAFFDIETASDFTAANILSRQVLSATDKSGLPIPSGINSVTISDPVNFNAVHDFSNPTLSETSAVTALSKNELSHYSGDPGRVAPGVPGSPASATPSVGPVPHPFYGLRVTFPGSFLNLAYEASEWEFRVVSDRVPMWGRYFGWSDQTTLSPFWYMNFYNDFIDSPDRLMLAPVDSLTGADPYRGWILVPGSLPSTISTIPVTGAIDVPLTEPVSAVFSGVMNSSTINTGTYLLISSGGPVSGTVSYSPGSKTATFMPDLPLPPSSVCTAIITTGAADLAGNALTSPKVWTFTTAVQDLTPPTVTAMLPGNGTTYLSPATAFTATFSEAIDPTTLTLANFSVAGITGSISYEATTRTASFTPSAPLANNTTYTATIGTGVRDLAGNPLTESSVWSVTTIPQETVLPYVVTTFPADRAVNVVTSTAISASFSKAIDPATLNGSTFSVAGVTGTIGYDAGTLTATFTPAAPLAFNTSYALTVTTGVHDLSGNPVGLTKNFTFRTLGLLAPNFSASGTVTMPGGTPLPGVRLVVSPTSSNATAQQVVVTNAAGQYSAAQLLNGTYLIVPSSSGILFSPRSIFTSVTNGNVSGLNLTGNPLLLTADKPDTQTVGSQVVFTATVQGGIETYEYQYWLWNGNSWTMVQDYGPTDNWVMPGTTPIGVYTIQANVRAVGSTAEKEVVARVTNYRIISPPATSVDLTAGPANAQTFGNQVVFTAVGPAPTGYEYEFWLWNGAVWALVQGYSSTATWQMPTTTPIGLYTIQVNIRGAGSAIESDAVARVTNYRITAAQATSVDLTANPLNTQTAGNTVNFTAVGHGSTGYEFQFWLFNGVSWSLVQDFSTTDNWQMPVTTPTGLYTIQVNARGAGSTVESDAIARVSNYQIVP